MIPALEFIGAVLPAVLEYVKQLADPVYDEEKERQAHMKIARAAEDYRAAQKFGQPGPI